MNNLIRYGVSIVCAVVFGVANCTASSLEIVSADTLVVGVPSKLNYALAHIVNKSGEAKEYFARVTPLSLKMGHFFSVCVPGICLSMEMETVETPTFIVDDQHDIYGEFYLTLLSQNWVDDIPINIDGESLLKVDFINVDDSKDNCTYNVKFVISAGAIVSEIWTKETEVFPNPVSDFLTIKLENTAKLNSTLRVMSANSTVVMEQKINTESELIRLNTNGLNSGNYYFSIESDGKVTNSGSFVVVK